MEFTQSGFVLVKPIILEDLSGANKIYKDDCQKKEKINFPSHLWNCISFKGPRELTMINLTINAHVCIEMLGNSFISSRENWFVDEIFFFFFEW